MGAPGRLREYGADMDSPDSLPLVFESGVLRFDDDGALHVYLVHSPDDPHPMVTHPDGRDAHVPAEGTSIELTGAGGKGEVRGHFPQVADLPEGAFVLTVRGYDFVQVEGSGDVSVLVRNPAAVPDWFDPGKVHRFARDGAATPSLWEGSRDPAREAREAKPAWTPPADTPRATSSAKTMNSGCMGLLGLFLLIAFAGCPAESKPVVVVDDDATTSDDERSRDGDCSASTLGRLCFPVGVDCE